jgi:methionyl-tRNA formyltransferase
LTVRVVLCTSGGAFGTIVLQSLRLSRMVQVVGVIESSRVLKPGYSWWRGAYEQIRTSGLRYALYLWCATGLADLLGRYSPRGSMSLQAIAGHIPRLITRDLNAPEGTRFLLDLAPDLMVSAFFNQRIEERTYRIPASGAVNIHPSLLPRFRGVDPVFFMHLKGQQPFGVTVHRVDASLDTGDILMQQVFAAQPDDSVLKTTAELYGLGADWVAAHARALMSRGADEPQYGTGTYDSWPCSREVSALRAQGFRLVHPRDLWAIFRGTLGAGRGVL